MDAFEELYVHSRERLFVYAFSLLKDENAAQDLVQELFVDFWENQLFRNIHSELIAYLVRSVRNRCFDYKKKEQNRERLRNEFFGIEKGEAPVSYAIEAAELGSALETAIDSLPPMPARVFRLHYIEKLSYREIADQLQISSHTVSNHMTRALKQLREHLKNS